MSKDNKQEQTTYAQDVQRIQDIINKLSEKDCDIDKMLDYVNEAAELIEKCNKKLSQTGIQIDSALNKLNEMKTV